MLKDYLEEQGIVTVLLGDYLSGAAGDLPANIFPALWVVKDEQYNHARWLIEEFPGGRDEVNSMAWRCPVCGESVDPGFDICWNCTSPRIKDKDKDKGDCDG